MNDFTKDELRNIADAILYAIPTLDCRKEVLISIRDKVKSMIENYCDHTETYEDMDYQPMRCKKCLELLKDE